MPHDTSLDRFCTFGDNDVQKDYLAELIRQGIKTATCSALTDYQTSGEALPKVGDICIVIDSQGLPICKIETVEVFQCSFNHVDANFAFDEGEGDRSLGYWRAEHERFFRNRGIFSSTMMLVCERFKVIA